MSKIQAELAEVTEVTPSARKQETITSQDYLKRLAVAILELPETDWNKLSKAAQDWYNAAADAIDKNLTIPEFPDMPQAEGTGRRRGAAAEAPAAKREPKEGDEVKITTKRGKVVTGKLAVIDSEGYQLESGEEFGPDVTVELVGGADAADAGAGEDLGDPAVGCTVQIETKRGKVIMGIVKEIDSEGMLLEDSTGEQHDISIASTKSVVVKVKATTTGGRRGAATADKPAADTKAAGDKPAAKPSVTNRVRELMADSLKADGKILSKDDLSKKLKAEGLEVKQSTADLTYNDFAKVVELLRDRKLVD